MVERYYACDLSGHTFCAEHMAENLAAWFPETAERVAGPMVNYEGHDVEKLRDALIASEEIVWTNVKRLGTRMGDVSNYCESLH